MKHCAIVMACLMVSTLVLAENPAKENRLKAGATTYALRPIWWTLHPIEAHSIPLKSLECTEELCRYTVPACTPLLVDRQDKNFTSTLPSDKEARHGLLLGPDGHAEHPVGFLHHPPRSAPGPALQRHLPPDGAVGHTPPSLGVVNTSMLICVSSGPMSPSI